MTRIRTVGVVGAGTMGRGIAELAATHGFEVLVHDNSREALEQAPRLIEVSLQQKLEKWAITEAEKRAIQNRIRYTLNIADLQDADLVMECITEDLAAKRELFRTLDQVCHKQTILASNTSTLSITEIAAATFRPDRCIGLHFMQPVTRTKMVEMVRGLKTSDETVRICTEWLRDLDRVGVEVYESPGYITTRLQAAMINDAANLVMEGVATPEAVDTAMRLGMHMEMGPLEMADRIGLDTLLVILDRLWHEYGDPRFRPSPLLRKLVRAGHTGVEAGQGFYRYDAEGNRIKEDRP
ncbi:MAG: 3-hydroxyacyl-CoA dehydrogenase family protein [Firmicutes bacterium]|nr:3-hydroxyacyl-CoA dehydrogenase family protein [Bacillota bacterium]